MRSPPNTNRYFLPYYIEYYLINEYWKNINSYNIWNIKDDADVINKPSKKCSDIDDGLDETYYLITPTKIK